MWQGPTAKSGTVTPSVSSSSVSSVSSVYSEPCRTASLSPAVSRLTCRPRPHAERLFSVRKLPSWTLQDVTVSLCAPALGLRRDDLDAVRDRVDEALRRNQDVALTAARDADARRRQSHLLHAIDALDRFNQLINLRTKDRPPERPAEAFGFFVEAQGAQEVVQTLLHARERLGLAELREELDGRAHADADVLGADDVDAPRQQSMPVEVPAHSPHEPLAREGPECRAVGHDDDRDRRCLLRLRIASEPRRVGRSGACARHAQARRVEREVFHVGSGHAAELRLQVAAGAPLRVFERLFVLPARGRRALLDKQVEQTFVRLDVEGFGEAVDGRGRHVAARAAAGLEGDDADVLFRLGGGRFGDVAVDAVAEAHLAGAGVEHVVRVLGAGGVEVVHARPVAPARLLLLRLPLDDRRGRLLDDRGAGRGQRDDDLAVDVPAALADLDVVFALGRLAGPHPPEGEDGRVVVACDLAARLLVGFELQRAAQALAHLDFAQLLLRFELELDLAAVRARLRPDGELARAREAEQARDLLRLRRDALGPRALGDLHDESVGDDRRLPQREGLPRKAVAPAEHARLLERRQVGDEPDYVLA